MRSTESPPRHAIRQFWSCDGAATGELICSASMRTSLLPLVFSFWLAGCQHANNEIYGLINGSTTITLVSVPQYLDGGSVSYIFTNQNSAPVVIFLPNPNRDDSTFRKNGTALQRIFVTSNVNFNTKDLGELKYKSREEKQLIHLVENALGTPQSTISYELVQEILLALKERRYDWKAVDD